MWSINDPICTLQNVIIKYLFNPHNLCMFIVRSYSRLLHAQRVCSKTELLCQPLSLSRRHSTSPFTVCTSWVGLSPDLTCESSCLGRMKGSFERKSQRRKRDRETVWCGASDIAREWERPAALHSSLFYHFLFLFIAHIKGLFLIACDTWQKYLAARFYSVVLQRRGKKMKTNWLLRMI